MGIADLDQTSWTLTGWADDSPFPDTVMITAEFGDGAVQGDSGVNRYRATVTDVGEAGEAGAIAVGPAIGTRMAGPPEAMAAEQAYLARLASVTGYRSEGDRLLLLDAAGAISLELTAAEPGTERG